MNSGDLPPRRIVRLEFSTTVSIVIANFDPSVNTADQLYNFADKALYRSKKGGKNRITTYRH